MFSICACTSTRLWRHKLCAVRMRNANVRNELKLLRLSTWAKSTSPDWLLLDRSGNFWNREWSKNSFRGITLWISLMWRMNSLTPHPLLSNSSSSTGILRTHNVTSDLFLQGPEKFSHPESHGEISNLMITELFNSHILNMNRDSLHTKSFRRIHFSVFRYRQIKNSFGCAKSFRGFRETSPSSQSPW